MLYIVTYATHSERYFDILKNHPEIIILGYGETWESFHNKIYATCEFCKTKNPDDIICFVDGFDSVILASNEEIMKKYKKMNHPLIFSQDINSSGVVGKFLQDKIFGTCNNQRVNSGMYIGTSESIVKFWDNFQKYEDDQIFATKKCRTSDYMKIDHTHELFYNFSVKDDISYMSSSKRIQINNMGNPAVISAPAGQNINNVLTNIGFSDSDLPEIKINFEYRFNANYKKYLLETAVIFIIFATSYFVPNKQFAFQMNILFFCLYLEYVLFTKHIDVPFWNKFLYTLIDGLHIILFLFIFYLLFNLNCNIYKLLLLNSLFFISLFLYFAFKKSVLTEISNKLVGVENRVWPTPNDRAAYFLNINIDYNSSLNSTWLDGNKVFVGILSILNIYCLWNIYQKKMCNTGFQKKTSVK